MEEGVKRGDSFSPQLFIIYWLDPEKLKTELQELSQANERWERFPNSHIGGRYSLETGLQKGEMIMKKKNKIMQMGQDEHVTARDKDFLA